MKCPKCGYNNVDWAESCKKCRTKLVPKFMKRSFSAGGFPFRRARRTETSAPGTGRLGGGGAARSPHGAGGELPGVPPPSSPAPSGAPRQGGALPTPVPGTELGPGRTETPVGGTPFASVDEVTPEERPLGEDAVLFGDTMVPHLAGLGSRFAAFVLDNVFLSVLTGVTMYVTLRFAGTRGETLLPMATPLYFVLSVLYFWILIGIGGQTLGKRLFNITVVSTTGEPVGLGRAFLRLVGYFVSSLILCIGFLWAVFDPNKQGLHDKIARTYVVKD